MNQTARVALLLLCSWLLLAGCSEASDMPIDRRVSLGTHALHLYCQGKGSPAVVIDTGSGETAEGSSHHVHLDAPELVLNAVRTLIRQVAK